MINRLETINDGLTLQHKNESCRRWQEVSYTEASRPTYIKLTPVLRTSPLPCEKRFDHSSHIEKILDNTHSSIFQNVGHALTERMEPT
jgi:hypothetical protein